MRKLRQKIKFRNKKVTNKFDNKKNLKISYKESFSNLNINKLEFEYLLRRNNRRNNKKISINISSK